VCLYGRGSYITPSSSYSVPPLSSSYMLPNTLLFSTHLHGGTAPSCETPRTIRGGGGHSSTSKPRTPTPSYLAPFLLLRYLAHSIPIFTAAQRHLVKLKNVRGHDGRVHSQASSTDIRLLGPFLTLTCYLDHSCSPPSLHTHLHGGTAPSYEAKER
jgi:hypothetical protein